jgi:membrane associated rhomboid family serine protease
VSTQIQTCYRHSDRRAGVVCQRCDRPICPDCMRQASVGFHCPECTKQGAQKIIRPQQLLHSRPLVTQVLIAINAAIFVAGVGSGLETRPQVAVDYALISEFTTSGGAVFPGLGVAHGEWYRLVTSGFLHVNIIHIGFNMLVLYQLGQLLEPAFGRLRFGLVYGVSLLTGSLGVMLVSPNNLTMGASGAVFGLMGFAFMALRARGIDPFSTGLGGTIVLNLIITFTLSNYISVGGHVGGLIGGVVCGWILTSGGPRFLKDDALTLGSVVMLGLVVATSAVLIA